LIKRVTKEDAFGGARRQLMWSGGCEIGVTKTPKNTEMRILRWYPEEKMEGSTIVARTTRAPVE
jgi:hypothetical protein